jgi:hypothetical protein
VRGLGAIRAVLGTTTGLDGEKRAKLNFALREMFLMHLVGALEEIEKRQGMELLKFGEDHDLEDVRRVSRDPSRMKRR